ncbi:MAG: hypothetical protein R3F65_14845 [bacterium]
MPPTDDDDLLGDILAETELTEAAAEAKQAAQAAAARAAARAERAASAPPEDPADRARRLDSAPEDDDGIERSRRAYTADPRHNILGLSPGSRFAFVDSGADLDGEWTVVRVELDGAAARLVASRDGKSPPYVKVDEDVVREELGEGRIKPL